MQLVVSCQLRLRHNLQIQAPDSSPHSRALTAKMPEAKQRARGPANPKRTCAEMKCWRSRAVQCFVSPACVRVTESRLGAELSEEGLGMALSRPCIFRFFGVRFAWVGPVRICFELL